jgi:hypothetical protein
MTDNQYILLAIGFLIVIREGFQQRDRVDPNQSISALWHSYGFVIRFLVFGLLYRDGASWLTLTSSVILMWPLYNLACNIGGKKKWYYVSKKGIDLIIRKILFFVNFDK